MRHGHLAGRSIAITGIDFASIPYGAPVACFWPQIEALDPIALFLKLDADDFPLALPCVADGGGPLVMRAWKPGDPLQPSPAGGKQPLDSAAILEPRCVFVPVAAFDAQGWWLGDGSGAYDRTLERLRAARPKTVAIGVAFDEQKVDAIPRDANDQPLDWMMTPSGAKRCRRAI